MFEKMNEGGSIEQTQSQFRCPKSNYVSETSSFNIKIQKVTKSFRKIYTKGVVDGHGFERIKLTRSQELAGRLLKPIFLFQLLINGY